jgi:hypothetical protein
MGLFRPQTFPIGPLAWKLRAAERSLNEFGAAVRADTGKGLMARCTSARRQCEQQTDVYIPSPDKGRA